MRTDDGTKSVIVSDLHIGHVNFRKDRFIQFVKSLDPEFTLILNGDTIDNPYKKLGPDDEAVVNFLREESRQRPIIWLRGNHDEDYRMEDPRQIRFANHLEIGKRLMVVHGENFDGVMPRSLWFIRIFHLFHRLRIALGAHPVHVAETAKTRLPFLYRVLTEEVKKNAVDCAIQNGFEAITCGHVHYVEESFVENVRYINTGTWTEEPSAYLAVTERAIELKLVK